MIDGIYTTGLQIHLDGIKNTGTNHSIDTLSWNNLINNDSYSCLNSKWDKDGIYFYKKDSSFINLDQHNDYIFSFEVCFSLTRLADSQAIVSNAQAGGWELAFVDGRLQLSIRIGSEYKVVYGDILINTEKIYYITGTFDKRYIKLYNEGSLIGYLDLEKDYNMVFPQNNTRLILGGNPNEDKSTMMYFTGKIYSFRYYNISLTEKNIKENYLIDSNRYPSINGEESYDWVNLNSKDIIIDEPGLIGKIEGRNFYKKNHGPAFVFVTYVQNYTGFILLSPDKEAVTFTQSYDNTISESNEYIYYDTMKWYVSIHQYWVYGNHPISGFVCLMHNFDSVCEAATYFLTSQKIQTSRRIKEGEIPIAKDGRVKYVRVRSSDGSYSNALAFIVDSSNVDFEDNRNLDEHLNEKALESIYSENGINLGRSNINRNGNEDIIKGEKSAAIGHMVHAEGDFSLATGSETIASGLYAHAEGKLTEAKGQYSHAEGGNTIAEGLGSHAEGYYTKAIGEFSHAEGELTEAKGKYSHAEGSNTVAEGDSSLALGNSTIAKGKNSIAAGLGTIASSDNQFVHGTFNIEDTEGKYLEIIGNGTDNEHRSNAYAITKTGDVEFSGKVTAEEFDGPAIYDIQGQEIADYVYKIEIQNGNELLVTKGSGAEEVITLNGWENIQEKIGSWSCKNGNIINRSERKIVNFGYINRTTYRSACIFYCQLVLYANPSAEKDTVEIDFRLYIDDIEYDSTWNPKETLRKGYHVITLMCPIRQIQPDKETVHMIAIKAKTGGGSASYETGGIRAAFFGMGVDSGDVRWDGKIVESENLHKLHYNITFEEDDYIHRDYNITYQEKMHSDLVYRTGLIEVIRHNLTDNVFEHNGDTIKGLHYNITFEDYGYTHKDYNIEQPIKLFTDALMKNQDNKPLPDLVMLQFKVLGEYYPKYDYKSNYVTIQKETDTTKLSNTNLLLQQFFSSSSNNIDIDTGRAVSLGINFAQFANIDTVQIKEVV